MTSKKLLMALAYIIGLSFSSFLLAGTSDDVQPEISKEQIRLVIDKIVLKLKQSYIHPQKAKKAAARLTYQLNTGVFGNGADFLSFRQTVLTTLTNATGDSGFDLILTTDADKQDLDNLQNAAIEAEVLDNNIGYLQISGDFDFPKSITLIEQYFKNIVEVDGLIIDLRTIDKGSVELTQKMIGFFVEPGKVVGSVRSNNGSQILKATETKGFDKFKQNFPLYILNSGFVTGPWELFSHSLQQLDKATVVGDQTMGVGFVNTSTKVAGNIVFEMTGGIITGPDPQVTWNEQGVEPDYHVQSIQNRLNQANSNQAQLNQLKQDKALEKAYQLALKQIVPEVTR